MAIPSISAAQEVSKFNTCNPWGHPPTFPGFGRTALAACENHTANWIRGENINTSLYGGYLQSAVCGGGANCCINWPAGQQNYTWLCSTSQPEIPDEPTCKTANPVQPGTGRKRFEETDYSGSGTQALVFTRYYSSEWTDGTRTSAGLTTINQWDGGWRSNYHAVITQREDGSLRAFRPDARMVKLEQSTSGGWVQVGGKDTAVVLQNASGQAIGYTYRVAADDSTETYNTAGRLLSIQARNGWVTTLTYSDATTPTNIAPMADLLIAVRNHFGRELRFTYDAQGRLAELLPPGAVSGQPPGAANSPIRYRYAETASLGTSTPVADQLSSVTWPDGNTKRYHYEDARWPQAVTGITDEGGTRYGTYTYDTQGRVSRSELAGGTQRLDFAYGSNASGQATTAITDYASGGGAGTSTTRNYTFSDVGSVRYPIAVTAPCPLCGSTAQATQYDAAGNKTREVAHDGSVTFYAYNTKGQETERATFPLAYQSALTRPALRFANSITSTRWHATWNLPTQVAQPGQVTSYSYNTKGMLTGLSTVATTDATGAAKFSAVRTGPVRATGYGYNINNLNTSIVERTDGVETQRWRLAYNASGDLTRITDVTGGNQSATLTNDAHGRLTRLAASNGALATFGANSRGQMITANTPSGNVSYVYDARNLINEIRFGDGRWVRYSYSAAQKLIEIRDSGGLVEVIAAGEAEGLDPQRLALRVAQWLADRGDRAAQLLVPEAKAQAQVVLIPAGIVLGLLVIADWQRKQPGPGGGAGAVCCGGDPTPSPDHLPIPPLAVPTWLTKIGVMLSGQGSSGGQSTAPSYDKAGLLVSPQACIPPPGNCSPGDHERLQNEVDQACAQPRQCTGATPRSELMANLELQRSCAVARDKINKKCFSGGNLTHRDQTIDAWKGVARCEYWLTR
ncbi:DUF6531 domain-containing protein [Hydrogenophaga sp.]|uniref:DUF6531 domain-containing protein n=1 Tax=Hydrogenophaga sp. TaxID=1904254 RepID=UPI00260CDCDF|nr:DUF6531 domain-containing protein [Hydrogenophaga sp.]MDM7951205.1 DUF6531 domain-containing protein [Hydrogenophaga sp.]